MNFDLKSSANQVAVFFVILGFNFIFFSFFASISVVFFFGTENLYSAESLRYISSITQLGVFGLTAFECAYLFNNKHAVNYLQINTGVSVLKCFLIILIAAVSLPALSHIIAWNEGIKLPQFMSAVETWMREKEDTMAGITSQLLSGKSVEILLVNLAVMAVITAVCEEFLFRGLIITWFRRQITNIHVVVFISACIFSAIHLQFYGFVPRFLLGLYLGYLFVWTGSIWACIIAHFINNGMVVTVAYLFNNQFINTEHQDFGNVGDNYLLIVLSVILTTVCIYFLYRKKENKEEVEDE